MNDKLNTWLEDTAHDLKSNPVIANFTSVLAEHGTPLANTAFRTTPATYNPEYDRFEANLLVYMAVTEANDHCSFVAASGHRFAAYGIRIPLYGIEIAMASRDMLRHLTQQRLANAYVELMSSVAARETKFLLLTGSTVPLATPGGGPGGSEEILAEVPVGQEEEAE